MASWLTLPLRRAAPSRSTATAASGRDAAATTGATRGADRRAVRSCESFAGLPAPKMWTAAEDQDAMDSSASKPAARSSGNEQAPNHANYDEIPPIPIKPSGRAHLKNGRKVTSAAMWSQRRANLEDFDREVLGRVPKNAPK
jgi:hypothetical protein